MSAAASSHSRAESVVAIADRVRRGEATAVSVAEGALARIDAGTYGTCEVCEQPVAAARLEAMPSTRYCIDHA